MYSLIPSITYLRFGYSKRQEVHSTSEIAKKASFCCIGIREDQNEKITADYIVTIVTV